MKKIMTKLNISKTLSIGIFFALFFGIFVFLPAFSKIADASILPPPPRGELPLPWDLLPPGPPPFPELLPPPPEPEPLLPPPPVVKAANNNGNCASSIMSAVEFKAFQQQGLVSNRAQINVGINSANISIFNNTNCYMPVNLVSWKMYDRSLSTQTYFDSSVTTIPPHSSRTLSVNLPSCMAQIDSYFGSVPASPVGANLLIGWDFSQNNGGGYSDASGNFCTNTPALNASCAVNPASAETGENVVWSVNASGGTGSYTYSWSGTGNLTGNSSTVYKIYTNPGTKTGTVTITSGSQTVTRTCNMTVTAPPDQALSGSCAANPATAFINNNISWTATAAGGTGSYTYSWTGTDGLSGNTASVSNSYSTLGTKTGTVIITSGSQSITRNCSAVINQTINNNLSVSCSASPSTLDIDEEVVWRAYVSGGNGDYDYDWNGTDDLSGNSRTIYWSYDDNGTKRATVTVQSGNQSASASCTARVEDNNDDLSVSCYASPSTAQAGSRITWYARVSGGDGDYDYDWTGTNNLNSSSRSPSMTYSTTGRKSATVTVTDGDGQEDTATCYANVNSVLAYSENYQAPLAGAVYLSQVPYTGVADNMKLYLFIGILALFSAWVAYIVVSYKKNIGELN